MSVYYKFRSAVKYDTVTFDGQHISVKELKNAIMFQKRIGKNNDVDLQIMDSQTESVYTDVNFLIPKNASLLIARIPVTPRKTKQWESHEAECMALPKVGETGSIKKAANLSNLDVSEDEKIRLMMLQSTQDYDPSKYKKIRGFNQVGNVPPNYRCHKCLQGGHWIKDCIFADGKGLKKSTGIPRSFMMNVEGPQVPGAKMIDDGQYAVPLVDYEAYNQKVVPAPVNKLENLVEDNNLQPFQKRTASPPEVADVRVIAGADRDESKKFSFSEENESDDTSASTKLDSIESSLGEISSAPTLNEPTSTCDSAFPLSSNFSDSMSVKAALDEPTAGYGNVPSIVEQAIPSAHKPLPPAMCELSTFQNPPPYYSFPFPWYTPDTAPEPSSMALQYDVPIYPPRHYGDTVGDRSSTRTKSRRYHRKDECVSSRKDKPHTRSPSYRRIASLPSEGQHTHSGSMDTSVNSRKRKGHFRSPSPRMSPPHKEPRRRDVVLPQNPKRFSKRESECLNNQCYDRSRTLSHRQREAHFRLPSPRVSPLRKDRDGGSQSSLRSSKKRNEILDVQRHDRSRTLSYRKSETLFRSLSSRVSPPHKKRRRRDGGFPQGSNSKGTSYRRHHSRDRSMSPRG